MTSTAALIVWTARNGYRFAPASDYDGLLIPTQWDGTYTVAESETCRAEDHRLITTREASSPTAIELASTWKED